MVLIDTWWNVNAEEPEEKVGADACFNRYMVECELTLTPASFLAHI